MEMEFSSYMFLGVGVAISVIGFFLKREASKSKAMEEAIRDLQVAHAKNCARDDERWLTANKVMEDRREDVRKLYDLLSSMKVKKK